MTATAEPLATRLLASSARHSFDPEVDVDWDAPPVEGLWWMQPERMSLYGTPTWDRMSEEQRVELSRHEVGSMASVGAWFEIVLMQLLLRELYTRDIRTEWAHYALTEIGDETRHCVMFGKALARNGVPAYGPRPEAHRIARLAPTAVRGASLYAAALIGEEPVDRWQRDLMKDDRIQPLIRTVAKIHVTEEARHVSFARAELADAVVGMSRRARAWHQFVVAQTAYVTMRNLVNPAVYAAVGLDPKAARVEALRNPSYRATIAWMGEKVVPYLDEHGMVGAAQRKLWKASFLVP